MAPPNRQALQVVYGDLGTTDIEFVPTFFGLLHADATSSIIAVHGLGADVDWTWTWKSPDGNTIVKWLEDKDMLPKVVPRARIIVYSYDSRWHANAPKTRLTLCGEDLVHSAHDFWEGDESRPVIFLGHSLGGNVIQHALLYASSRKTFRYLAQNLSGLIFLGTPFRGSKLQWFAGLLARLLPASHSGIIDNLSYDSHYTLDILQRFCTLLVELPHVKMFCFFEAYETDYGRKFGMPGFARGIVVEETSACIPGHDRIQLQTDHIKMNKFTGPHDRSYIDVSAKIRSLCDSSKHARHGEEERNQCLRDLLLTDPAEDLSKMKRKKGETVNGTCDWFLQTKELQTWLDPQANAIDSKDLKRCVLWLHGKPGIGKSCISMYLVDRLPSILKLNVRSMFAYFLCDTGDSSRQSTVAILRGLIYQLLQQSEELFHYIMPNYKIRGSKLFDSSDALWSILLEMANDRRTGTKYCLIDALDECDLDSQKMLLKQIEQIFNVTDTTNNSNLRLLITSRPYPEIKEDLQQFPNFDLGLSEESKRDIRTFIDAKMLLLQRKKHYPNDTASKFREILFDKAEGTFLWVGLACEDLAQMNTRQAVIHLNGLPKGLFDLYSRLLNSAFSSEEDRTTVTRILKFVAIALRPMTTSELSSICGLIMDGYEDARERFVRDWVDSCRLLVMIQDDKVVLLHKSVKDFLTSSMFSNFNVSQSHAELAHACINDVLSVTKIETGLIPYDKHYSIQFWVQHASMAGPDFAVLTNEEGFFGENTWPLTIWAICYDEISDRLRSTDHYSSTEPIRYRCSAASNTSALHVGARYNIPSLINHSLGCTYRSAGSSCEMHTMADFNDSTSKDGRERTPLTTAIYSNHYKVFTMLLRHLDRHARIEREVLSAAAFAARHERRKDLRDCRFLRDLLQRPPDARVLTADILRLVISPLNASENAKGIRVSKDPETVSILELLVSAMMTEGWTKSALIREIWHASIEILIAVCDAMDEKLIANHLRRSLDPYTDESQKMRLLIHHFGEDIVTEESFCASIANHSDDEVIGILSSLSIEIGRRLVTDAVLASLVRRNHHKTLEHAVTRFGKLSFIRNIFIANYSSAGVSNLRTLINLLDQKVSTLDTLVLEAARQWKCGTESQISFLDLSYTRNIITRPALRYHDRREVICIIRRVMDPANLVCHLLDNSANTDQYIKSIDLTLLGRRLEVKQQMLINARKRDPQSDSVAKLHQMIQADLEFADSLLYAVVLVEDHGDTLVDILLKHLAHVVKITEPLLERASRNLDPIIAQSILKTLLKHCSTNDPTASAMVEIWESRVTSDLSWNEYRAETAAQVVDDGGVVVTKRRRLAP